MNPTPRKKFDAGAQTAGIPVQLFAICFGAFLALAILKFGTPVILDGKISPPRSMTEFVFELWPIHWAYIPFAVLALVGLAKVSILERVRSSQAPIWLLLAPVVWLGWQILASKSSVDPDLSGMTLPHLAVCVGCFALGFLALSREDSPKLFWLALSAGLCVCLIKAARQHLFEFSQDYQHLTEGLQAGWTNFTPSSLQEMQEQGLLVSTNGIWVPNPTILLKLQKGRSYGTLVYPNALANLLLLLGPWLMVTAINAGTKLRPVVRAFAAVLAGVLLLGNFYWTGSKAAWLVALLMGVGWVFNQRVSTKFKWLAGAGVMVAGAGIFLVRFSGYLEKGATSAAARLEYWKVAWKVAIDHPLFGSGPGTFQRPYALAKPPEAEMTRLVHNDFLQQASDAGWIALIAYAAWVGGLLWVLFPRVRHDPLRFALWLGFAGWCAHSAVDFCLYVPPAAWTAFTVAGLLLGFGVGNGSTRGPETGTQRQLL